MSEELVTITVDGKEVQVPKGMLLVEAAKLADTEIPIFCYHPKLDPAGVCRMCLVEVEGQRKPLTACTTPVMDGMVVHTKSEQVQGLQRGVLEFLLLNHPLDCPVCDKGGECPLQDNTFKFGPGLSRSLDQKVRKEKAVDLGNFIVFDRERCILCRRCTRFDHEITQEDHLVVTERAHEAVVTTADGNPFNSYFSGNTIELCPVGALTSDIYRFKARPWDLARTSSVCTGCSVGCNVTLDFRFGELVRVISRDNPETDGGWLCDRGRFNYRYVGSDTRIKQPMIRKNGELVPVSWEEALSEAATRLRTIQRDHGGKAIGAIGGGRLTNEEAYLFQKLARTGLGTPNLDWRAGEQYVASNAEFSGRLSDINQADAVLLVDILLAERAPVADLRVRRVVERGGAVLAAVGPAMPKYRSKYTAFPSLVHEIPQVLKGEVLRELLRERRRLVVLWSGRDAQVGHALVDLMREMKAAGAEVHLLIPGEQTNAWGAEAMGVRPDRLPAYKGIDDEDARAELERVWQVQLPEGAGWNSREMFEQAKARRLKAMYLVGVNPMGTYPDRSLVEEALDAASLVIVQDMFLTETAAKADILFPVASFPAKSGHYTTLDGLVQGVDVAMEPEFETQSDRAIITGLAQALGVTLMASEQELQWEMQHLAGWGESERLAPAPAEMTLDESVGAHGVPGELGEADLYLVPVERLFAGGGTSYFDDEVRHARPRPVALLHPEDAAKLHVEVGDGVMLVNGRAELSLEIGVDDGVMRGTVQVPKGLVEAPVNALGPASRVKVTVSKPVTEEVG